VAWIKRVLDSGAEGIILPQARSAEEVRAFVSSCRYPPMGTRGFGPRRPTNYGRAGGAEYLRKANQNVFVVAQIETVSALEELDAIVAINGLDSLVVGPYDLSGSMGMLGEVHHPRVLEAIRRVADKARAAGLYVGMGMGADAEHALVAARLGVQWAQCGNDFEFMIRGVDRLYAAVRERWESDAR
jgi:2-keto-3-deoxy-L-rhamnonate aldolase RhmA